MDESNEDDARDFEPGQGPASSTPRAGVPAVARRQDLAGRDLAGQDVARQDTASPGPRRRRQRDPATPVTRKARRPLPEFTGLVAHYGDPDIGFHDFLPEALQIVYTPPSRSRQVLAYVVCGAITAALLWSIFGHLRLFAIAPGELQARGGNQVVEPLEAGQVSAIPVQNGNHVAAGAIVLQIDPTAAQAVKTIVEAKLADARAEAIRHGAAAFAARATVIDQNAHVSWPKTIPAEVRGREETVLRADLAQLGAAVADLQAKLTTEQATRDKYVANIAAQKTLIDSRTKRTAMHETLADQGWDSRAMVLQSLEPLRQDQVNLANYQGSLDETKAAIPVIANEIVQARESFIAQNVAEAAKAERQVSDLIEQRKKATQTLTNMTLRAPVSGSVQALAVTNIGQSVKVGDNLMQIVPDGAPLEIQAYVLNTDIGFVRRGQKVIIKVDTFPYTRYGTIEGKVTHVGADAITGKYALQQQKDDAMTPSKGALSVTSAAQQMKDLVFPVTVVPATATIAVDGRDVPLTAGMSVVVEIETERQRAINYILHPLTRVFDSGKPHG